MFQWNGLLEHTFALRLFPGQLALAANRFGFLTRFLFRRFFEMLFQLHFTKNAFTLKLFLQSAERLFDIVITNIDLHVGVTTFLE